MAFSCCKCFTSKTGKENNKALKIQSLVTPRVLYHKKPILNKKLAQREKVKRDATEYQRLHVLVSYETPLLFPPVWSRVRLYVCVCVCDIENSYLAFGNDLVSAPFSPLAL